MEILAWQAHEAHRLASEHLVSAARYREERDKLIRQLYSLGGYSYGKLAKQIGCSPELIAKVIQGR